jgi:hypothetical protein
VGILRSAQRLQVIFVFVDVTISTLFQFSFFLCFFLGLLVLIPQHLYHVVSIKIAVQKGYFKEDCHGDRIWLAVRQASPMFQAAYIV